LCRYSKLVDEQQEAVKELKALQRKIERFEKEKEANKATDADLKSYEIFIYSLGAVFQNSQFIPI
jgi:hypothetical protein